MEEVEGGKERGSKGIGEKKEETEREKEKRIGESDEERRKENSESGQKR